MDQEYKGSISPIYLLLPVLEEMLSHFPERRNGFAQMFMCVDISLLRNAENISLTDGVMADVEEQAKQNR